MTRTTLRRMHPTLVAVLSLVLLAIGCSPRRPTTVPVSGIVTLDGEPVAGAAVMFEPEAGGVPARASTAADGSYKLSTFRRGDGALVGRHRVTVAKIVIEGLKVDEAGLEAGPLTGPIQERSAIPSSYGNPATSGLMAEINAATSTIDLPLTSRE